ncbi:unnamed protein product, partial [Peniophora sp. CBMAI 1063]
GELGVGGECEVGEGRREEARGVYEALKGLEGGQPSDSRHLALAYIAYTLTLYTESLAHLSAVRDLAEAQSRLQPFQSIRSTLTSITTTSTTTAPTSTSAAPSTAPSTSTSTANGNLAASILASGFNSSFASLDTSTGASGDAASIADISNGATWAAAEVIRSVCLQGMCIEKLEPSNAPKALEIYLTAVLSLPTLESSISGSAPAPTAQSFASFVRYRELWRWAERLLYRAIVLAARVCVLGGGEAGGEGEVDGGNEEGEGGGGKEASVLWSLLAHYQTCSAHWPPTFRPKHRTTIASIHVRALILASRLPSSSASSSFISKKELGSKARRVIKEARDVIGATTSFPRADQRNSNVEELVECAVAAWEASGADGVRAGWVMDILWWATRLTFNSPLIYRHMTRLAHVSSDHALSLRTLRLYISVVGKARQAGEQDIADTDANWVDT